MTIEIFRRLSESLCDLMDTAPALAMDEGGLTRQRLSVDDMHVHLLHSGKCPTIGILLMDCGALPQELGERAWLDLLDLNYAMLGHHTPCFSRHPVSGHILLQCTFELQGVTAQAVAKQCDRFAAACRDWRAGKLIADTDAVAPGLQFA